MDNGIAVVVGVGGMGEAIALAAGRDGAHVVLADLDEATLERVSAVMRAENIASSARVVDVASRESISLLARQAAALGPIRQVAWTAGLSPIQASVNDILAVDLVGVAHGLDEFGAVIAQGGSGVVIASMSGTLTGGQLSSEVSAALQRTPSDELIDLPFLRAGAVSTPGAAYGIAKRANQLRVQSASLSWGARGARINTVSPGIINTPMGERELAGEHGDQIRALVAASGTGRLGTPDDVLRATLFLLGPDSSFITGADLLVDGGVVAAVNSGALDAVA